jgi:WD40 repeat protein
MYVKIILFLISFCFNNNIIGMIAPTTPLPMWTLQRTIDNYSGVNALCINKSETLLGIASCNSCARIIDFTSGKIITFLEFKHGITSLCFKNNSNQLATLTHKPETSIFDIINDAKKLYNKIDFFEHKGVISSIYFDDNNNNVLGLKSDENNYKDVHITNLKTNEILSSFRHNSWVTISAISPLKNLLATGSGNTKARLFNIKQKKEIKSFELNSPVTAFTFNYDETLLAIALRNGSVRIFNLTTYKEIVCLQHDYHVLSMCFGQSGNIFITGSIGGKIRIFVNNKGKA